MFHILQLNERAKGCQKVQFMVSLDNNEEIVQIRRVNCEWARDWAHKINSVIKGKFDPKDQDGHMKDY